MIITTQELKMEKSSEKFESEALKELFLLKLCDEIHKAERLAEIEQEQQEESESHITKLVIFREDKVSIEIRKENVSHNQPHAHIKHSDKFDISISLTDFSVLAGEIDKKSLKHLVKKLSQVQDNLLNEIWNGLNEKDSSIKVEKLIKNLPW